MIATNTTEFLTVMAQAEQKVLNSELGQEITNKMLAMSLEENPQLTAEQWEQKKQGLIKWLFVEYIKQDANAMAEFASHMYTELRTN